MKNVEIHKFVHFKENKEVKEEKEKAKEKSESNSDETIEDKLKQMKNSSFTHNETKEEVQFEKTEESQQKIREQF